LNNKFLTECLDSLLLEYDQSPTATVHARRPLFEAAYLLLHQNEPYVYDRLRHIPPSIRDQERFMIAARLLVRARSVGNYPFILTRFVKLPFVLAVCVNVHITRIQFDYIRSLAYSTASRNATISLRKVGQLVCPFERDSTAVMAHVMHIVKAAGMSCVGDELKAEKCVIDSTVPLVII
jgi:hypothetical protein